MLINALHRAERNFQRSLNTMPNTIGTVAVCCKTATVAGVVVTSIKSAASRPILSHSRLTAATRRNGEGALLKHGALVGDTGSMNGITSGGWVEALLHPFGWSVPGPRACMFCWRCSAHREGAAR